MADTLTPINQHRLLGHPADLDGHVRSLGPLPHASSPDWAASFWTELSASGLAGRGGAAFPAALKLAATSHHAGPGVLVVNGMEGEPASHKDKVLLIRSPHLVLDGALLLALASGAQRIVVCVPTGRDQVAEAVQRAVAERERAAYSHLPVTMVRPPDRFVAGEESALSEWIASGRSLPSYRPDKGIPLRLGKERLLVHNAETLAHVALIGRFGSEAFRSRGVPEEPGTMLITISGSVAQPGVIEVPCGTPLHEVVARGTPTSELRALLVGGYAGAWVPPRYFSYAVRIHSIANDRRHRRRRRGGRAGRRSMRRLRDGSNRPVHGRPEFRAMRSLRVWSSGHRRGSVPAQCRPSRCSMAGTHRTSTR